VAKSKGDPSDPVGGYDAGGLVLNFGIQSTLRF
jgi:hypothetical protein